MYDPFVSAPPPTSDLTPELIQRYAAELRSAGVSPAALRRTLELLGWT